MAVDKLERLLDLIATLLHTERPLTASELRERIPGYQPITDTESFKRAFERDKVELREMDVPLEMAPIPGRVPAQDGYRIDPAEYYLPDPGLDADELAALHLAMQAVQLDRRDAAAGLRKLGAPVAGDDPSVTLPHAPNLSDAFDAVGNRRQVRFRYRDRDRVVDPFRLHLQRGRWYLQGHDHGAGEPRSFRLDRVQGRMEAGEPDSITHDLDPAHNPLVLDGWALGDDPPVDAVVRVAARQASLAVQMVPRADVTWLDDGAVELRFAVRQPDGFRSFVLEFLDDAEILGPQELRDDFVSWLEATVAAGGG